MSLRVIEGGVRPRGECILGLLQYKGKRGGSSMGVRETDRSNREEGEAATARHLAPTPEQVLSLLEGVTSTRLRETLRVLESIVEVIPQVVFLKDASTLKYVRFNTACEKLLGTSRAELLGRTDADLFPKEQADKYLAGDRDVLRTRASLEFLDGPVMTPTGEKWLRTRKIPLFDEDGAPAFVLGISEDVTEQREMRARVQKAHEELELRVIERTAKLLSANEDLSREIRERRRAEAALRESEDQLRQAQKMEAIGQLAGGVAHDFNNLLSVIVGYAQVIMSELPEGSPVIGFVREIQTAGLRAAKLTKQLLAFGRKQVLVARTVDLNEIIQDMTNMLARIIGEDVDLRLALAPTPTLARLDPTQVEQVVMNLVVNARDAMPHGGTLTVETAHVNLDLDFARAHLGVTPGPFVLLTVTDTGIGMDETTQARMFEPFFTTKESGRGTGLGLSTVFGIVQQSGGSIWAYTEKGRGTTFQVYFPATAESDASSVALPAERERESPGGDETILLVEDDPQVRGLVESVLARDGYTVMTAASAHEAMLASERFSARIDLLLTDVVMPTMSGVELAQSLLQHRPAMKVLFMSGYADSALSQGAMPTDTEILQKPVAVGTLTWKVREVLDGAGAGAHGAS